MKKKILIVAECFYPEEFKINDVALDWKNRGYKVDVLTMVPTYPQSEVYSGYKNKFFQKENWQGIDIYRVRATTGYKTSLYKKLLRYITFMISGSIVGLFIGKKYDYVFGFNTGPLTAMMPVALIHKFYGKSTTLWIQDIWPDSVYAYGFRQSKVLSYLIDSFVKFIYRHISSFAISGRGFESKLLPYIKQNQSIKYCPNWADSLDMNARAVKLADKTKVHFTFAGNIGKVQNLHNIITAFDKLPDIYQNKAQLNVIGNGSALEELKKISSKNNIIFHGRKPRDLMARYYKASDFLIVSLIDKPIFSLTVPAKTQTYILAQKPILGFICGDTADIISDNNLGYTAPPDDIENIMATFIKAIDTNQASKKEFAKNCKYLTNTVFNKDNTINALLKLLKNT